MIVETKAFGNIEIQDTDVITFEEGVPGFPDEKKFAVVFDNHKETPFMWLQAINNPRLTFVLVDPHVFKPDYEFVIDNKTLNELGIDDDYGDVVIFSIVVIPENISQMTANLKAPIIINYKTRKGKQYVIEGEKYSVRHYILEEIKNNFGAEGAPVKKNKKVLNKRIKPVKAEEKAKKVSKDSGKKPASKKTTAKKAAVKKIVNR